MAVIVKTTEPAQLVEAIRDAIKTGSITTWSVDADGDFTHKPEQWANTAWFHPSIKSGQVVFNILGTKSKQMTKVVYGVYHGRFCEMLLTHFDEKISEIEPTVFKSPGDVFGGSALK